MKRSGQRHPAAAVDVVIFRVHGDALEALLVRIKRGPCRGRWAFPGGLVQIMDLTRPPSTAEAHAIVMRYSGSEPEVLRRDFFASLCAAFEPDEVRAQLRAADLPWLEVEPISDRHIAIHGRAPR